MTTDDFVSSAIERGGKDGIHTLTEKERVVYLVSESEVLCDMEGIETLVEHIERKEIFGVSEAFAAIGAEAIASCLKKIEESLPARDDDAMMQAEDLIIARAGYSYEAIKRFVENG